jgi:threonylcarbamoyladenosine tRNA methylthiotransferase MtaB
MLVESGTREVILTGTNIGDYGMDWAGEGSPRGKPLEDLVSAFFARTNLERLRISSLDPTEITPGLLEIARSEPRFCPHFHVSLQSPHAKILRLMKRRYGLNEIESCLNAISALPAPLGGAYIGMDVITGFPGESLEDFEESVAVLKRLPWTRLHVFPYSEREGTAATRLPHAVPREERLRRTRVLNDLSVERLAQFHSQISGTVSSVLFENPCRGPDQTLNWLGGYTPNYVRVLVPKTGLLAPNQIHNVTIESVWEENRGGGDFSLVGKTIQ